jgi:hypothetical protein
MLATASSLSQSIPRTETFSLTVETQETPEEEEARKPGMKSRNKVWLDDLERALTLLAGQQVDCAESHGLLSVVRKSFCLRDTLHARLNIISLPSFHDRLTHVRRH